MSASEVTHRNTEVTVGNPAGPELRLRSDLREVIAKIDADCRIPPFVGMKPQPLASLASIDAILSATRAQGTDLPEAMWAAFKGDGYLLSHQRRLLAITLARALPELARLRSPGETPEAPVTTPKTETPKITSGKVGHG